MNIKEVIFGIATFIPGVYERFGKGTGGTDSARYCYSVWLRHLIRAHSKGLNTNPKIVAELGPGDSIGIGLSALISGVEDYYAFDVVQYANITTNVAIFDELVAMYREKQNLPADDEYPNLKPYLDDYSFPDYILTKERMEKALDTSRIEKIRKSILDPTHQDSVIKYKVPWFEPTVIGKESVDMIFSQAVLEHVDDLENTYKAMHAWLKKDGFMTHQIDFKSHNTAKMWNGHWAYSDLMWTLLRGKRAYLLNRQPHSTHIHYLNEVGFNILLDEKSKAEPGVSRNQLARRFRGMSEDDFTTSGAFVLAAKK